uniref:uncharacterized protein LOC131132386 n=1 Tax=Doryrhamphus excisus TaxID=161450 RepID=UPI0025ADDA6A|nr:uncharacterized protein LOC131132386 [Doryrhamphus excisus]
MEVHAQFRSCTGAHSFSTLTVRPGQNVSMKCPFLAATTSFKIGFIEYGPLNPGHRIKAIKEPGTFDLQISPVEKSDAAVYYCLKVQGHTLMFVMGAFLQITEPEPSVSVLSEAQPGQPVKFQCSVLSQSGNEICQDGYKLHWFRTGPDNIHPSFVSTHDECKKVNDKSTQKCIHTFSKNISSSDAGTYICAVATCGRIFMGNPIKVFAEDMNRWDSNTCSIQI